jgi:aspartate/methionine/tyrosine aminotransferase
MYTCIDLLVLVPHTATLSTLASALQAYGMMGWRVGYIAYPAAPGGGDGFLGAQLLKVQDTIPVCPPQLSQVQPSQASCRL